MSHAIYNKGRCGQNSTILREKFEADVLNLTPKPDYVLIYIGMNDVANRDFFTPLDKYIENMAWVIEAMRKVGARPVICTIHHLRQDGTEATNRTMDRYNAALKDLATKHEVGLADFNAVKMMPADLDRDGCHLTPSGNKLLAKTFFDVIAPQLRGNEAIICVGDSLTYGYLNEGAGSSRGETYPAILRRLLAPSTATVEGPDRGANMVGPGEMCRKDQWGKEHLFYQQSKMPFSFIYGGKPSEQLLAAWPRKVEVEQLDDVRTQHTVVWTDSATGLEVRCVLVDYATYPVLEWTVYFKNTGKAATPIVERIQGLDILLDSQGEFVLHHNQGDTCGPNAYEPFSQTLTAGSEAKFSPVGGRPTSLAFPYFNVQNGGNGVIIALGWPGQWAARFAVTANDRLQIRGGQELTHLRLQPGEEVRTPLTVLMFWEGDYLRSQNLWRRWMFAHNLPRRQGKLPPPVSAMCAGLNQNETGEKGYIEQLVRNDARLDYWWMDAGWYPGIADPLGIDNYGIWSQVGTWMPDRQRFPGGVKAVADFAHDRGMRLVLWFELERVSPCSLWRDHPQWLLSVRPEDRRFRLGGKIGSPEFVIKEAERNQIREDDRLLNLGNPEALRFLTDYMSKCIADWGIDLFRLDFNISPLLFWRTADAPDRQGMTENNYVCGLLKFFDELRARHPDLLIDSCASGGRRIDLETLRRTVVYTRSDYWCVSPTGDQCQTAGIASWVPHYMCAAKLDNQYNFRSNIAPSLGVFFPADFEKTDWALFRQRLAEWRGVADCFYGDYYPLSEWNNSEDGRLAWQFNRAEQEDGVVQAFRRPDCGETAQVLRLHGLDPAAQYELTNLDVEGATRVSDGSTQLTTGKELMEKGLTIEIENKPGAAVITYKRLK